MKIGFIGAPGVGKSTLAAGLFYHLKLAGEKTELVQEVAKAKVYSGVDFGQPQFDVYNMMDQQRAEKSFDLAHSAGRIDYLICEAPTCNAYFYSTFNDNRYAALEIQHRAEETLATYDHLFFVHHSKDEYETTGRNESQDVSIQIQKHIAECLPRFRYQLNRCWIHDITREMSPSEMIERLSIGGWNAADV